MSTKYVHQRLRLLEQRLQLLAPPVGDTGPQGIGAAAPIRQLQLTQLGQGLLGTGILNFNDKRVNTLFLYWDLQ